MPSTLLKYFYVLIGLIYLQMGNFKKDTFKTDIEPVAFSFFQLFNSSKNIEYVEGYYDNKLQ